MVEVQVLQEQKPAMRHTVSGNGPHFMPLTVDGTAVIYFSVYLPSNVCHLDDRKDLVR